MAFMRTAFFSSFLALGLTGACLTQAAADDSFRDGPERLRVNTDSIDISDDSGIVSFRAMWDFGRVQQDGFRSLVATIRMDCAENTYTMPRVTYYAGRFGRGEVVDADDSDDAEPEDFGTGNSVMAQAARAYCD